MQVRYRYRVYPTAGQRQALARAFGCARVVYNDCLRVRDECHAAGEKISDTEVQRRVVTLAKKTPERVWLGDVASVALVQACQDARRAYENWFGSLSGKRKGRKVRHPVPRRKHGRQSIRLTRNGFALHGGRLYVAKVGDIRVRWSRPLPSVPSSVTVIREPDSRYYASFVVERQVTRLPACDREVGIDLGLNSLIVTSGGEVIPNPRFLRKAQRRLKRAQRVLSRRQKGSANRARARRRVAVLHCTAGAEAGTHRSAASAAQEESPSFSSGRGGRQITLSYEVLHLGEGGQRMTIYQAGPGSSDQDALTLLSLLATGERHQVG